MAKGAPLHTGDPNIKTGTFEPKADQTYQVSGIERWISKAPNGDPIFVVDALQRLVVKFTFQKADGTQDGPACSATPAEFWAIVAALGMDVSAIPAQLRTTSESLTKALAATQWPNKTKTIEVTTNNGWVNGDRVEAARPPEGRYMVRFVGARSKGKAPNDYHFAENVIPTPQGKKTLFSLMFDFEIVGGPGGQPTNWDGVMLSVFFNDVFTDSYIDTNGQVVHATQKGIPLIGRTDKGAVLSGALQWEIFAKYFAPSLIEHDWKVNPLESEYHVSEVIEPQFVYIGTALKDKKTVLVPWRAKDRGKGMEIRWKDVPYENQLPAIQVQQPEPQPNVLIELITYIEKTWPTTKIFDQSDPNSTAVVFADPDGRKWANDILGGPNGVWERAGLTERKRLDQLTEAELTSLFNTLKGSAEPTADGITW